jgi:hypothetical protein
MPSRAGARRASSPAPHATEDRGAVDRHETARPAARPVHRLRVHLLADACLARKQNRIPGVGQESQPLDLHGHAS